MNIFLKLQRIKDLSPSERQLVEFILQHPQKSVSMGIVDISEQSYTSTGTVVRLCKKMGLEGFIQLRMQMVADLNEFLDNISQMKRPVPLEATDTMENIVNKISDNNARAVMNVKHLNGIAVFEKVVAMMNAAKQIDFYGSGVSNLIGQDSMMKALRLGIPSTAYNYYSEMAMLAKTSDGTHLAFLLSYTGQTEETLRVARLLHEAHVPSVSITSDSDNPLLELCDVNLFVDSYETIYRIGGMSSRISTQHVLDILFSGFLNANAERFKEIVNRTFLLETFSRFEQPQ